MVGVVCFSEVCEARNFLFAQEPCVGMKCKSLLFLDIVLNVILWVGGKEERGSRKKSRFTVTILLLIKDNSDKQGEDMT